MERNPKSHGMFSREAATEYDEFDSKKESYRFVRNIAVTPLKIQQPNSDQRRTPTRIPNDNDINIKEISNSDNDGSNDKIAEVKFTGKRKA